MKTQQTIEIEEAIIRRFNNMREHAVLEVTIGYLGNEICDAVKYDVKGNFTCFEIKTSVDDFRSKNKVSFHGHFNCYVLTNEVYEKVKDEIPKYIGVYTICGRGLFCRKRPTRKKMSISAESMIAYMLRSAFNKTNSQRRGLVPVGGKE